MFDLDPKKLSEDASFRVAASGQLLKYLMEAFGMDKIHDQQVKKQTEKMVIFIMEKMNPFLVELLEVVESQREEVEVCRQEIDKFLFTNSIMITKLKKHRIYDGEASQIPDREQLRKMADQRA